MSTTHGILGKSVRPSEVHRKAFDDINFAIAKVMPSNGLYHEIVPSFTTHVKREELG